MRPKVLSEADAELIEAAQWYEDRQEGLGEKFLSCALDAFRAIELHPRQYAKVTYRTRREIRRHSIGPFPYHAVYEVRKDLSIVVAIAHVSRRPGYWRDRLG